MRLLVVEDEPHIRQQICDQLKSAGYVSDACGDGKEAVFLGSEHPYDLAIIDLGLPSLDGIEVVKQLRENGQKFPILILTARGNWQDKVEGLEAGADDYVVKPFQNEELLARINALLRRAAGHATPSLNYGALVINTSAKTVCRDEQVLELTSFEYNTLEYLALNSGKLVSKTELTEHLYDQDFDRDSNVIEVFIGRLRKKLDPTGDLKPIDTVRGQGYRFSLALQD